MHAISNLSVAMVMHAVAMDLRPLLLSLSAMRSEERIALGSDNTTASMISDSKS